jgi:antitoxin component YwqK of YwqJK toxin-antitoxin module
MYKIICLIFSLTLTVFAYAQTQTDATGKKQGYWRKVDEKTHKLVYEGLFKDDKPQGKFKYYYPFDSIKAIMDFRQDGKFAYSTMFHPNGKKMAYGKYIGENKDSVWTYYDEKVTLISRETYLNGQKNGIEYIYFPDGVVSEEKRYKTGKQDGVFKSYYEKNLVKSEGTYVNGYLDGKNIFYYPEGNVTAAVGYYKNGKKVGPWIYRDKKGKVTEKELYKPNGELATKKETEEFFSKNKATDQTPKADTKTITPKPKTATAKPKTSK